MQFTKIAVPVCMIALFTLAASPSTGVECTDKLEAQQCNPTETTSQCTLSFPSYNDECYDMVSLQTRDLDTYFHYSSWIGPGEWGLSNIRPAPPNVVTVCGQYRECQFQAGAGPVPDMCVAGSGPWVTYWDETAYDWDDVCQAPEEEA